MDFSFGEKTVRTLRRDMFAQAVHHTPFQRPRLKLASQLQKRAQATSIQNIAIHTQRKLKRTVAGHSASRDIHLGIMSINSIATL